MNATKDKLFSIIAHDLRSPFTSLIGLSDFIVEDIEELSREEIKSFASMIRNSAQNVFNLLENLLQWSRFQTGRMDFEPTIQSLKIVAEQAITILEGKMLKKNINIENELEKDIYVYADDNMINSIVQNLLSNALKFTNNDGIIKLETGIEDNMASLYVTDNGVGMPQDVVDKLFRIDTHHTSLGTEKEVGSGLGLVLCKELVNKNGGEIYVESEKGKGSTFKITLPLADKKDFDPGKT